MKRWVGNNQPTYSRLWRFLMGLFLIGGLVMAYSNPVEAAPKCQTLDGHQLCLESIKRSAKYHWEYRVTVSVDSQKQPAQRYDCRQTTTDVAPEQPTADLTEARIRQWVCGLVRY
jgi:hypothetical protein